nr:hypothetical protein [Tanacetum cinerariifolium]
MKIQAGVQVSRPGELRRHLQLWKPFGRLYFAVNVLDRNIEMIEFLVLTKQWHQCQLELHHVFLQPTTNSENLPIQETKLSFRMVGLLFNKFKEERVKVLLVHELKEMIQLQEETMSLVKQRLLSVITVRVKGIWKGNVHDIILRCMIISF